MPKATAGTSREVKDFLYTEFGAQNRLDRFSVPKIGMPRLPGRWVVTALGGCSPRKRPHGAERQRAPCPSRQRLQQRLGLLQVGRVKAFREPAVDRGQQRACLGPLALVLPQPRQAHGGAQLQRVCLLAASSIEGLMEVGFCY